MEQIIDFFDRLNENSRPVQEWDMTTNILMIFFSIFFLAFTYYVRLLGYDLFAKLPDSDEEGDAKESREEIELTDSEDEKKISKQ